MQADSADLREIIRSGDFSKLKGLVEGNLLECKGQPYDLVSDGGKRELAKDVSSFANSDGGLIIIGARTKKGGSFGDEIDEIRPFERNMLNPNQYHNVLRDWVYPTLIDVEISFHKTLVGQGGIFLIDVPKQPADRKPFLIKKTLEQQVEQQRIIEIIFGYVERIRDNSQPWSVVDLQTALRKGLNYEKNLEQQFKLEAFPAFKEESWQVKQLILEKPDYWHFLLTEKLLRSKFQQVRLGITDLERGSLIQKHRSLSGQEFRNWFLSKFQEMEAAVKLISVCINTEIPSAWSGITSELSDPTPIFSAVNRLYIACNALLEWEFDVFAVHPPDDLEPLRLSLLGSTKEVLDEIASLPDHMAAAVKQGREHTGPDSITYNAHLELRFTRSKLISDTIEQLKNSPAWNY
jgi:hypothetical protein